ncbi:MAG: diaminopimelate epimerase [bacterium]|nr:diaminopimelate epimerase [bacterium]
MKFSKMEGAGNDFIVIDDRRKKFPVPENSLVARMCARKKSIGADGVILLQDSRKADFKMRIFNPDGGEAEMCGNGARCAARFAYDNKIAAGRMKIETLAGMLIASVEDDMIKIKMSDPKDLKTDFFVSLSGKKIKLDFVNTGVPHAVLFVESAEQVETEKIGREIRNAPEFSPSGANVNFVEVCSGNLIKVRTYERGVEAETLACGTGIVASAIISHAKKKVKVPVKVIAKSGDIIIVDFGNKNGLYKNVYMIGPAKLVYVAEYTF